MWKVFRGTKKTTKQEVAIFVFEKKQLERWNKEEAANLDKIIYYIAST